MVIPAEEVRQGGAAGWNIIEVQREGGGPMRVIIVGEVNEEVAEIKE